MGVGGGVGGAGGYILLKNSTYIYDKDLGSIWKYLETKEPFCLVFKGTEIVNKN